MLAGVAGGLAEMLDADPSIIRVVWALLVILTGGIALVVYIVMAIVVPERPLGSDPVGTRAIDGDATAAAPREPVAPGGWIAPDGSTVPMAGAAPGPRRRREREPGDRGRGGLVAGLILILLGAFFLIRQFVPAIDLSLWWPIVAIAFGSLLVILSVWPARRGG